MNETELLELQKKTKAEIIQHFSHLASAVEAKDKELADLRNSHHVEIQKLQQDTEQNINARLTSVVAQHKQDLSKLQTEQTALLQQNERRVNEINKLLYMYGDLLKTMESVINTHLTLNQYTVTEIRK